jgi:hypothetical protein
MVLTLMLAGAALLAVLARWLGRPGERCPECGLRRAEDAPLCSCGWIFEPPEGEDDLEYGDEGDRDGEPGRP